jgi:hypothetical protein
MVMAADVGALTTLGLTSGWLCDDAFADCPPECHLGSHGAWIVLLPSCDGYAVGDSPMRLSPELTIVLLLFRGQLFAPDPVGADARLAGLAKSGPREAVRRELSGRLFGLTRATAQFGWFGGSLCQCLRMSALTGLPVVLGIALDGREADRGQAIRCERCWEKCRELVPRVARAAEFGADNRRTRHNRGRPGARAPGHVFKSLIVGFSC